MGNDRSRSRGGIYAAVAAMATTVGLGIAGAAGADQAAPADIYAHDPPPRCFSESETQCDAGPASVEINTGESVTWHFDDGTELHNVASSNAVAADPAWESYAGDFKDSGSYSRQFNQPGTYEFFCQAHLEMTGTITVTGQPVETATSTPTSTPSPPSSPPPTGDTDTPPPSGTTDAVKPTVRSVRPTAIRRGVRVRFTLSEAATVTVRVKRARRVVKSARVQAPAGTRTVTLRSKRLKKGRYTIEIEARDGSGNRSLLATKRVTLRR